MTNSDESAQHAFELRRHLGVIHSQATLLEDEAFGPITADQRDALEEIIAASLALTGETATTVEPAVEGYVTDHDAQILEESPSELASPVTPTEIVLALDRDDEFVDLLARQFERAGYTTQSVTEAAELPALLERPEPQHLVLDCRFPSGPFLESLERTINATDGETAVTLVSTVVAPLMNADRGGDADTDAGTNADGDADTNVDTDQVSVAPAGAGPLQGLAGILSPTVSVRTLEALFEARFGLTAALLEADTTVAVVGDVDERFLETLEAVTDCGHSNERDAYVSSRALSMVDPAAVDCVFLTSEAVDRTDDATLAAFRRPTDDEATPVVVVDELPVETAERPDDADNEWLPIRGYRTPRATPLTATELAAVVLTVIEPTPDTE
ncbi:response regulator [Natronolimnobius baerhuensis]|uniref:Response regulatory domain-containing protein n=1 Tax=Natronolimnobius baerhuensis TaxID=253108 RepID=A0A202EAV3_9EURY|nr:hypothetical protein [Natronolimnobius baerhuensis]OVE85361.1 hypothetical protein B2G88_00590 [Natronolimnobius baerhuensis]